MKRTPAQIEASKKNGAKSKGPVTEEGKARSSRNATRHGLAAHKIIVLDGESEEEWQDFHHAYIVKFQPRDPVEEHLVLEMAANRWRLQRAWALQTATIDTKSAKPPLFASEDDEDEETIQIHARCYSSCRDQLDSLTQQETRLTRNFDRALRNLTQMRKQFPIIAVSENEPEPVADAEIAVKSTLPTKSQNEPENALRTVIPQRLQKSQALIPSLVNSLILTGPRDAAPQPNQQRPLS